MGEGEGRWGRKRGRRGEERSCAVQAGTEYCSASEDFAHLGVDAGLVFGSAERRISGVSRVAGLGRQACVTADAWAQTYKYVGYLGIGRLCKGVRGGLGGWRIGRS